MQIRALYSLQLLEKFLLKAQDLTKIDQASALEPGIYFTRFHANFNLQIYELFIITDEFAVVFFYYTKIISFVVIHSDHRITAKDDN